MQKSLPLVSPLRNHRNFNDLDNKEILDNKEKINNTYSCKLENYTVLESNINFVRCYIKQTPLSDSQMDFVTIGKFQSLSELHLYNEDKATNLTVQF